MIRILEKELRDAKEKLRQAQSDVRLIERKIYDLKQESKIINMDDYKK